VLEHRLGAQDPLQPSAGDWEREAQEVVFSQRQVSINEIAGLLGT
jgi:acyl-CoA dehydrogenase